MSKNQTITIGETIKDFMDARYIKSSIIATGLGCSVDTVSKMLNSKRKITVDEYFSICRILDVNPNYFYKLVSGNGENK